MGVGGVWAMHCTHCHVVRPRGAGRGVGVNIGECILEQTDKQIFGAIT